MTQPVWVTEAGNLGTYPSNTRLSIQLEANPLSPGTRITYTLLSGYLPASDLNNLVLSSSGEISGVPKVVQLETEYTFTVRASDEYGNFRDRTFSIMVAGIVKPSFLTAKGKILDVLDSRWVNFQLEYTNPLNEEVVVALTTGVLPPGLEVSSTGLIYGYPKPPLANGIPTTKSFTFSLSITSSLGTSNSTYTINVRNHSLTHPKNTRAPVILNSRPLSLPINTVDPFYDYYMLNGKDTILVDSNSYMNFKVIGQDFDENDIVYEYNNLPLGLIGDTKTGWITGIPQLQFQGISKFKFNVRVAKAIKPAIVSDFFEYYIIVKKDVAQDVVWNTDSDLGTMFNGSISTLSVSASSALPLQYRITGGTLPPNLELLDNGLIVGRTAFQPTEDSLPAGEKTKFEIEIEAFNSSYPLLTSKRTFSIIVQQYYDKPIENVYIKAVPSIPQRKAIYELLKSDTVFPTELLYRPRDPYFGKSSFVTFVHIYGQVASSLETYLSGMDQNHFNIQLVLGAVKTAKAKDDNGNTIYEVVYCEINDENNSPTGKVAKDLFWPRDISRNLGPYDTGATEIFTSDSFGNKFNTSLTPGYIRMLHPASLANMRARMAEQLGQNLDNNILPKWMTSQQDDGSIIGYTPAWVICYANPGAGETIKQNVIDNFGLNLNDIDFTVDRYIIDKSATFNWNPYLNIPAWTELPSAYPTPYPLDTHDLVVVFPEKSILPKNS